MSNPPLQAKYHRLLQFLPGRRAVITGAASGLGRAMALKLAADGWILCLIDRDADGLAALGKERPMIGASLKTYAVDVTQQRELEAAINAFCKAYGGVDLLVNSAGIGLAGQADQVSTGDWRLLFDVNVVAVGSATAAVLPHMRAANSGYIVNIASAAAYHCLPGIGAYSASKAAVVALTENLVAELAGTSIKASVMISAFFKSSMPKHTLGGRQASELAAGLMALSAMTSEEAAEQTLRSMEERRTYILVGNQARVIYWLKRLAPNLWLRLAPRVARKAFAKANAITASGGTQ